MRPNILFALFAHAAGLPGVGRKTATLIEKAAGGARLVDLLWHLPTGVVDRRKMPTVSAAPDGRIATLTVRIEGHIPPAGRRGPYRVRAADDSGIIDLVFFHPRTDWLAQTFPIGETRVVSGRVDRFHDRKQMVHPDHATTIDRLDEVAVVEPVYGLTAGLTPKVLAKTVAAAVAGAPDLPEWQDAAWLARNRWPDWHAAVEQVHSPEQDEDLSPLSPARARLAYDELLANQLALALMRAALRHRPGRAISGDGRLRAAAEAALPFSLTGAQRRAIAEISADMGETTRMLRLLQGDVGSGKTIVALMAMLTAVEAGSQAALLAPTEILARQHFATIAPMAHAVGVEIGLLTGRDKGKKRAGLLDDLAAGRLPLAVGTHALIQQDVAFRDLALAVVDEQHRFGVHQRLELSSKGRGVDVLVMTATPIPRTLQLTAYGDLDVSRLTDKPPGRQPIDTRAVPLDRLAEVVDAVARQLDQGSKVYWICPMVEESETVDLAAATERHATLKERFGPRAGLVHGRMTPTDKDAVMTAFADTPSGQGGVDLLVATTVVEVGVDVPSATIMVIEHAERFGLAQLHQLRGRIGRGDQPSTCLLVYAPPLNQTARARLATLRATDDGFRIAEEDLRLRGAGEVLGTRQSGLPTLRIADLAVHGDLLAAARDDCQLILSKDPDLYGPRGQALRTLLYLFERDQAVRYLRSG